MVALFPISELAMIATSFAAMAVLVAYSAWTKRHGQHHNAVFRRRLRK